MKAIVSFKQSIPNFPHPSFHVDVLFNQIAGLNYLVCSNSAFVFYIGRLDSHSFRSIKYINVVLLTRDHLTVF